MTGAVFKETLSRGWRGMLWWGLGLGSLAFISIIIIPDVNALEQMATLMESLPPFLVQALGGGDISFMATPEGYLAVQYFSIALLFFAVYAVVSGLNVTSNDEERGILDVFMSLPLATEEHQFERLRIPSPERYPQVANPKLKAIACEKHRQRAACRLARSSTRHRCC